MPYVMVPVPEEHVEDVMQFVLRAMTRAAREPWDEVAVRELFHDVDELSRALMAFVARGVLAEKEISEADAAKMIQLSGRETFAIQRELNERARDEYRPPLIAQRVVNEVLPNGRTTERRVFTMDEDVARLVEEAERDELRAHRTSAEE